MWAGRYRKGQDGDFLCQPCGDVADKAKEDDMRQQHGDSVTLYSDTHTQQASALAIEDTKDEPDTPSKLNYLKGETDKLTAQHDTLSRRAATAQDWLYDLEGRVRKLEASPSTSSSHTDNLEQRVRALEGMVKSGNLEERVRALERMVGPPPPPPGLDK